MQKKIMEKNAEGNKMARLILSTRSLNSDKKQSLEAQQAKKQKTKTKAAPAECRVQGRMRTKVRRTGNTQRRPR